MKLKLWVEVLLIIIAIISGMAMMYNVEISIVPFMIGAPIFFASTCIITEYGRLLNNLINKIDKYL